MLNNFIYAETKNLFLEHLDSGNILDEAIVFIADTKEIWNHGTYFAGDCGFDQNTIDLIQAAISDIELNKLDKVTAEGLYATKTELPNLELYITKEEADIKYASASDVEEVQSQLENNFATKEFVETEIEKSKSKISSIPITEELFIIEKQEGTERNMVMEGHVQESRLQEVLSADALEYEGCLLSKKHEPLFSSYTVFSGTFLFGMMDEADVTVIIAEDGQLTFITHILKKDGDFSASSWDEVEIDNDNKDIFRQNFGFLYELGSHMFEEQSLPLYNDDRRTLTEEYRAIAYNCLGLKIEDNEFTRVAKYDEYSVFELVWATEELDNRSTTMFFDTLLVYQDGSVIRQRKTIINDNRLASAVNESVSFTEQEKQKLQENFGITEIIENGTSPFEKGEGENSVVLKGGNNVASSNNSSAFGLETKASGDASHAEGYSTHAAGGTSHAEGYDTGAGGASSHAEGMGTEATGLASHAEGYYTDAKADYAHSEGQETRAISFAAHAEGYNTEAKKYAHAEGNGTFANGESSHAEGLSSEANGIVSHAEGRKTFANGECSHSEGRETEANGKYSHAEGFTTITYNDAEHASGRYNNSVEKTESNTTADATLFSIGIGESKKKRKNAFEVKQNGDIYIEGVEGRIQDKLNKEAQSLIEITHSELKTLRDNAELVPGQQYRITDYITTTTQENTKSANHRFDIIVTADTVNTLNENARACHNDRDAYFSDNDAKLESWEIKYCLDNDKSRFAWADDYVAEWKSQIIANYTIDSGSAERQPYNLDKESYIYESLMVQHPDTGIETPAFYCADPAFYDEGGADGNDIYIYNGTITVDGIEYDSWKKYDDGEGHWALDDMGGLYALTKRLVYNNEIVWLSNSNVENGKGVIYYMKDEWGNECPYDFKNIQFYHNDSEQYVYTFTLKIDSDIHDASVLPISHYNNNLDSAGVYNNSIKPYMKELDNENVGLRAIQTLNNITFIVLTNGSNIQYGGCYGNTFDCNCHHNIFGAKCNYNVFGCSCNNIVFGDQCNNNIFGNNCYGNVFGDFCTDNIFGNNCYDNKCLDDFINNSFGNGCYSNSFGNNCKGNSFGNNCYLNTFGKDCLYNSFGNNCYSNTFGNSCSYNSFGNNCTRNTFGEDCRTNVFDNYCIQNVFGNNYQYNRFGPYCRNISFKLNADKNAETLDNCWYMQFNGRNAYLIIGSDVRPDTNNRLNKIVVNNIGGTTATPCIINIDTLHQDYEIKVAKNSNGEIKVYCEADLIA